VRDDVLAKVHADFPRTFREKYVGALALPFRPGAGRDDALEADRLLAEWGDWVRAHQKELRFPKDVP
jgi:hypothetical protein